MCSCGCENCGLGALNAVYGLGLVSSGLLPVRTTAAAGFTPEPGGTQVIWSPAPSPTGEPLPLPSDLPVYIPPRNEIVFGVPIPGGMPVRSAPPGEGGPSPMPPLALPPDLPPAPVRETPGGGGLPIRTPAPVPSSTPVRTPSPAPAGSDLPVLTLPVIPELSGFPWKWVLLIGGGYLVYQEFGKGGRRR